MSFQHNFFSFFHFSRWWVFSIKNCQPIIFVCSHSSNVCFTILFYFKGSGVLTVSLFFSFLESKFYFLEEIKSKPTSTITNDKCQIGCVVVGCFYGGWINQIRNENSDDEYWLECLAVPYNKECHTVSKHGHQEPVCKRNRNRSLWCGPHCQARRFRAGKITLWW